MAVHTSCTGSQEVVDLEGGLVQAWKHGEALHTDATCAVWRTALWYGAWGSVGLEALETVG